MMWIDPHGISGFLINHYIVIRFIFKMLLYG